MKISTLFKVNVIRRLKCKLGLHTGIIRGHAYRCDFCDYIQYHGPFSLKRFRG